MHAFFAFYLKSKVLIINVRNRGFKLCENTEQSNVLVCALREVRDFIEVWIVNEHRVTVHRSDLVELVGLITCVEGGPRQIVKLLVLVRRCACSALLGQVCTARTCGRESRERESRHTETAKDGWDVRREKAKWRETTHMQTHFYRDLSHACMCTRMKMCGCAQTNCATEKCACNRWVYVHRTDWPVSRLSWWSSHGWSRVFVGHGLDSSSAGFLGCQCHSMVIHLASMESLVRRYWWHSKSRFGMLTQRHAKSAQTKPGMQWYVFLMLQIIPLCLSLFFSRLLVACGKPWPFWVVGWQWMRWASRLAKVHSSERPEVCTPSIWKPVKKHILVQVCRRCDFFFLLQHFWRTRNFRNHLHAPFFMYTTPLEHQTHTLALSFLRGAPARELARVEVFSGSRTASQLSSPGGAVGVAFPRPTAGLGSVEGGVAIWRLPRSIFQLLVVLLLWNFLMDAQATMEGCMLVEEAFIDTKGRIWIGSFTVLGGRITGGSRVVVRRQQKMDETWEGRRRNEEKRHICKHIFTDTPCVYAHTHEDVRMCADKLCNRKKCACNKWVYVHCSRYYVPTWPSWQKNSSNRRLGSEPFKNSHTCSISWLFINHCEWRLLGFPRHASLRDRTS